jgi:hypothetical protein
MPIIGLNNNVERNGVVYHIQTEDSGTTNPHIFTHLFVDGVILSTKRISYEHLLKREDLTRCIQTLMRWQHRQMYQDLIRGTYDAPSVDSQQLSSDEFAVAEAPAPPEATIIDHGPFRFGGRYVTARPLAEVVSSFMQSWRAGATARS